MDLERARIVLGVERDTPFDKAEERYRARARLVNPDAAPSDALRGEAAQAFDELNAAWTIFKQSKSGVPAVSAQDVRNVRFTVVGRGEGLDMADVDNHLAWVEAVLEHFEEGGTYLPALGMRPKDGRRRNRRSDGYDKGEVEAFLGETKKAIDQWLEESEVSDPTLHFTNDGIPDAASKWGIKEYVSALVGLVLILFVAGLVKLDDGTVALTERSKRFIENQRDEWALLSPEAIPEGWVEISGTGYSYGIPDDWYYAEPKDKYQVTDERTADSIATDKEADEDSSAMFTVLTMKPIDLDDFDDKAYAEVLLKTWTGTARWGKVQMDDEHGFSYKGQIDGSDVTVISRQLVVPEKGIIIDMKYNEGSGMKDTLQNVLYTWTWDE